MRTCVSSYITKCASFCLKIESLNWFSVNAQLLAWNCRKNADAEETEGFRIWRYLIPGKCCVLNLPCVSSPAAVWDGSALLWRQSYFCPSPGQGAVICSNASFSEAASACRPHFNRAKGRSPWLDNFAKHTVPVVWFKHINKDKHLLRHRRSNVAHFYDMFWRATKKKRSTATAEQKASYSLVLLSFL